jgi:DNA-binding PucR family transcriptional regulator
MEHASTSIEEVLVSWIQNCIEEQDAIPIPPRINQELDWDQKQLPLCFTRPNVDSSSIWMEALQEVLESYLPSETTYLRLDTSIFLCLVPMAKVNNDYQEELQEWISGIYDACQTELSFPLQIQYMDIVIKPYDLIVRVREFKKGQGILLWSLPHHKPITPWHLLLEQMVQYLTDQDRRAILQLYREHGSLTLLEQSDYLNTLMIFFRSNLNISLAAKELYLHRNTLIYRLDRITEETGLDPRMFKDAMLLQIVLLLLMKEHYVMNQ